MDIKFIKKLSLASYTNEKLDEKKVNTIVKKLSKSELKSYIKFLKNLEKQKTVYIYLSKMDTQIQNEFDKMFKDKKIIIQEDKSLIAGFKIIDNDIIYEQNIKNNMLNIVSFIGQ